MKIDSAPRRSCLASSTTRRLHGLRLGTLLLLLAVSWVGARADFVVGPGDVIGVAMPGLVESLQRVQVQPDGTITVPRVGAVHVIGLTRLAIQERIETILAGKIFRQMTSDGRETIIVIKPDDVAVSIVEYRPVFISGDVVNPGQFAFRPQMTLRQALALAGGVTGVQRRSGSDPAELQADHKRTLFDLVRQKLHAARLNAELTERDSIDIRLDEASPPLASALLKSEAEALKLSIANHAQERDYLVGAIRQAEQQIAALTAQEEQERAGLEADTGDLERAQKQFGQGNLPSPRVADIRRAVLLSSTRRQQTAVNLLQTARQRNELAWKLSRLDRDRRVALLAEQREALTLIATLQAKLDGLATRLKQGGSRLALNSLPDREVATATVVRRGPESWKTQTIDWDADLRPGDVIDVKVPVHDPWEGFLN